METPSKIGLQGAGEASHGLTARTIDPKFKS